MIKNNISLKQKIIGKVAEFMVNSVTSSPSIAELKKTLKDSKVAFITTAGVHLKKDKPFNTNGDHTFRLIPRDVDFDDLTITHDHYDKREALRDINCVFPLEILRNLKNEKYINDISPRHFGLMGYIPEVDLLINESAPKIADILVEDDVDIALLSPGWYICHQSVGLIQREIESRGIRTASIMHLPKVAEKVRPPRMMHIHFPLGRTFGRSFDTQLQTKIVKDLLNFAIDGGPEELVNLNYKWKK